MLPAMWDSGELDGLTVSLHTFRALSVHVTDFSKMDWRNFFQFCDSSWALDGSGSEYKANTRRIPKELFCDLGLSGALSAFTGIGVRDGNYHRCDCFLHNVLLYDFLMSVLVCFDI
jgi:hypothetical protein